MQAIPLAWHFYILLYKTGMTAQPVKNAQMRDGML